MGHRKLKVSVFIITIFFLCVHYEWVIGVFVNIIGPGLTHALYQDTGRSPDGGERGRGGPDDPETLPTVLFKDPFPAHVHERMWNHSVQVQGQLISLNTATTSALTITSTDKVSTIDPDCRGPKIRCGSPIGCELGCQIHHMMTCLIISYTTNRTLVPSWRKWPASDLQHKWGELFQPIGFKCPFDRDTGIVIWHKNRIEIATRDLLEYPFSSGFTIPEEIGSIAKRLGVDVFRWWTGQFAKFSLRLHPLQEGMIKKAKAELGFSRRQPTVGILVRRRDKVGEKKKTSNSLDKYMTVAKKYIARMEAGATAAGAKMSSTPVGNGTMHSAGPKRRVYLATDDKSLLMLARKQYPPPKWEILGFQRSNEAEDIVKDIYILAECDFVLCSFSSHICRLVAELKEGRELGGGNRVKSLDYKYFYDIPDLGEKSKFVLL